MCETVEADGGLRKSASEWLSAPVFVVLPRLTGAGGILMRAQLVSRYLPSPQMQELNLGWQAAAQ